MYDPHSSQNFISSLPFDEKIRGSGCSFLGCGYDTLGKHRDHSTLEELQHIEIYHHVILIFLDVIYLQRDIPLI
jgi:hypothetical protein